MPDQGPSDLTPASTLTGTEVWHGNQGGNSRGMTAQAILEFVGYGVIEQKIFDGTIATYTFSSIPGTFKHLELIFVGRSTASATNAVIQVQINGLSTSIYDRQSHYANNVTPGSDQALSAASWALASMAAANAPADQPGHLKVLFHHYTQTTFNKTIDFAAAQANSTSTWSSYHIAGSGQARTTNAITSLTLFLASGNFVNGSVAILTGRK